MCHLTTLSTSYITLPLCVTEICVLVVLTHWILPEGTKGTQVLEVVVSKPNKDSLREKSDCLRNLKQLLNTATRLIPPPPHTPDTQKGVCKGTGSPLPQTQKAQFCPPGCCLLHRLILLPAPPPPSLSVALTFSHFSSPTPFAQWEVQPEASFCFLPAALHSQLSGTVFVVVLHLASQWDIKPKASLHFSHILPALARLVCSLLFCPLFVASSSCPFILYPAFSSHLHLLSFTAVAFILFHMFSPPFRCIYSFLFLVWTLCCSPYSPTHTHPYLSSFALFLFRCSLFFFQLLSLFELKCCKCEIRLWNGWRGPPCSTPQTFSQHED